MRTSPLRHPVSRSRRIAATGRGERSPCADNTRDRRRTSPIRQEPLAALAAVSSYAPARVGALGPEAHRLGLAHDDGEDGHGPVRRGRRRPEGSEPRDHLGPVDLGHRAPGETGQELVPEIAPVDGDRSRLPGPGVAFEHGLGEILEQGLLKTRGLAPADRRQHPTGAGPGVLDPHLCDIADDLPDALAAMLAVDEEALAARGQHADAEAPEAGVAHIAGGPARRQRPDPRVGEDGSGHVRSPVCGCSGGTEDIRIRPAATISERKNDPLSTC